MNDDIKGFLIDQETPEMIDIYDQAWRLMETLNHTHFAGAVEELMMIASGSDIESFITHFRQLMHGNLDEVIQDHGLLINEDSPILFKIILLEFFIAIEKTELVSGCARLLESDETNNTELFCEVVSIVTGHSVDDIIIYMQPVQRSVIENMRAYILQREELEDTMVAIENDDLQAHYRALEQYCRLMKAQTTVGYVLAFQEDGRVGGDFAELLKIHLNSMDRTSVASFAKEIVSLAICSDGWTNPQVVIENVLPTITENLKELAIIQRIIVDELQYWKIEINKDK